MGQHVPCQDVNEIKNYVGNTVDAGGRMKVVRGPEVARYCFVRVVSGGGEDDILVSSPSSDSMITLNLFFLVLASFIPIIEAEGDLAMGALYAFYSSNKGQPRDVHSASCTLCWN